MIRNIEILLLAYYPDGKRVEDEDFIGKLSLGEHQALSSMEPGQSARIVLLRAEAPPFGGPSSALEHFESGLETGLLKTAEWLALQPLEMMVSFAQKGLKLLLFVDMWIDGDQMDLILPPELLSACGERHLPIRLITND